MLLRISQIFMSKFLVAVPGVVASSLMILNDAVLSVRVWRGEDRRTTCRAVALERRRKRSMGFTLIELLVVIGIIGLLAAMMFPVLSSVRMNAKKSSCLSNLHQIGIAVNSYVNDYSGFLPICKRVPDGLDDQFSVVNTVKIASRDIFSCPGDEQPKYDGMTFFQKHGTSYEWNTWLNGRLIDKTKMSMGGIILKTPLMGDAMNFHGSLGRNYLYPAGNMQKTLEELIE